MDCAVTGTAHFGSPGLMLGLVILKGFFNLNGSMSLSAAVQFYAYFTSALGTM